MGEETTKSTRRLTKKPPPGSASNLLIDVRNTTHDSLSLRSKHSESSLQRSPSAPSYSKFQSPFGHSKKNSSPIYPTSSARITPSTSSNSSLDRTPPSPISGADLVGTPTHLSGEGGRLSNSSRLSSKVSEETFIGAPFDGTGILNHFNSAKSGGYRSSIRKPPPPPLVHSQTNPDSRVLSPPLQHSASFSAGDTMATIAEKSVPRIGENQLITPKRYSDETKEPKPSVLRKQSGLKSMLGSMGLMSPRGPKISAPENPVHVTHVGYDKNTGAFTVCALDTESKHTD